MARVFFTPALLSNAWSRVPDGRVRISYLLEGEGTLVIGDGPPQPFRPGDMVITDTSMSMTMESTESVTGLHFGSTWDRFLGLRPDSSIVARPFSADHGYARVFASLLNSTLSSGVVSEDPAVAPLYRAADAVIESCVVAQTGWAILDSASPVRQLHDAATELIAREFHDPRLDVNGIALRLGVSVKHLQAAFRAAGETPSGSLRRARLARASTLLDEREQLKGRDLHPIAQTCGFSTALQLRRAIGSASRSRPHS
ncbi:hypothetical protein [Pseudoclavibacter sp. JSM 162008]|uniref:AraC family transcriptional regulator n=1 Tax=Pseudoclavibacter sp. JSM 162008 TaxID=3229855 RepID=UPI003524794B